MSNKANKQQTTENTMDKIIIELQDYLKDFNAGISTALEYQYYVSGVGMKNKDNPEIQELVESFMQKAYQPQVKTSNVKRVLTMSDVEDMNLCHILSKMNSPKYWGKSKRDGSFEVGCNVEMNEDYKDAYNLPLNFDLHLSVYVLSILCQKVLLKYPLPEIYAQKFYNDLNSCDKQEFSQLFVRLLHNTIGSNDYDKDLSPKDKNGNAIQASKFFIGGLLLEQLLDLVSVKPVEIKEDLEGISDEKETEPKIEIKEDEVEIVKDKDDF